MNLPFSMIAFLALSFSLFAEGEWLYYKHFPWVYDNVTKDWLYLKGDSTGMYAYRNSTSAWEEFSVPEANTTTEAGSKICDEKFDEWLLKPEPYGGEVAILKIKAALDNNITALDLTDKSISDLTPLACLTNLERLDLRRNSISDLSPLSGLTKLRYLNLMDNQISDLSSLVTLENLWELLLARNNITDVSLLPTFKGLNGLWVSGNNIGDPSPIEKMTHLHQLYIDNITETQKGLLEVALYNSRIY